MKNLKNIHLIILVIIVCLLWYIGIREYIKANNDEYLYLFLFVIFGIFSLYCIFGYFNLSKEEIMISSCSSCAENKTDTENKTENKLLPIMDPKFNLREVAKHLILLEDHLFHKGKRCSDCILKHCFAIDAFLDEGITLDKDMKYNDITVQTQDTFKKVSKMLEHDVKTQTLDNETCCGYAQQLRQIRKPLVHLTADMDL